MNKDWSEKNKKMQNLLGKEATFREGIDVLIELRDDLFGQITSIVNVYPQEAFYQMPFPKAQGYHSKTLAYSMWHIFRIEDIVAHTLINRDSQVLFTNDWLKKISSPIITTGNELKGAEIADFSKQLNVKKLYEYCRAVMDSTNELLRNLTYKEDIIGCKVAAIDPFFGEQSDQAAEICFGHGIPYVTIDAVHDSYLHRHAAINVVSGECLSGQYDGMSADEVMKLMMQETEGLTILTQGGGDMLYGRRGKEIHKMRPFDVTVRSTLGAGDTFKAGCVYALLNGLSDEDTVRFASACSAVAISRFPLPLYPPKMDEVNELLR